MRAILTIIVLAMPVLAGCFTAESELVPAVGDAPSSDARNPFLFTGIHAPDEIAAITESFKELPGVSVDVIGASVEGRPLHKIVLGRGPFELWAVGRHHGNEPSGAEAILQIVPLLTDPNAVLPADASPILRALYANRELILDRVTLIMVPVANPDGAADYARTNVNGQDLNRDYFAFTQPEPNAVRGAFWEHWPDACLDLHNELLGDTFDYDAFIPITIMEREVEDALTRAAWRTVYEVDAAGGFAGGPNENYRFGDEGVTRQIVEPTAIHPGTHDMFCSIRGAPGWTPEGAVPREVVASPLAEHNDAFEWVTRLHAITLASALFDAAGLYDGFTAPVVTKLSGKLGELGARHYIDVPANGRFQLQVVWNADGPRDKNLFPVVVDIDSPDGRNTLAREPTPDAFTATVNYAAGEAGTYAVNIKGPTGTPYEVRARLVPTQEDPIIVTREATGLVIENTLPRALRVTVTDVADADTNASSEPATRADLIPKGTLGSRLVREWDLEFASGEVRTIAYPATLGNAGPWRWFATDDAGRVATGVEAARSTE